MAHNEWWSAARSALMSVRGALRRFGVLSIPHVAALITMLGLLVLAVWICFPTSESAPWIILILAMAGIGAILLLSRNPDPGRQYPHRGRTKSRRARKSDAA